MAERKHRAPPRQDMIERMHTEALVNRMGKGNLFQRNNFTDNLNLLLDKKKPTWCISHLSKCNCTGKERGRADAQ